METKTFLTTTNDKGLRLDAFLQKIMPDFSRNKIKILIDNGNILINSLPAKKSGQPLKTNQEIIINLPDLKPLEARAEDIPLDIVFEDEYLAVINKPQGMVVHAGSGNTDKTLVNALLFHIKNLSGINGVLRPGIVHRLDKNTAGLMLVAKNDFAHKDLASQIEKKTCHREYYAILDGNLKDDKGVIETYISRSPKNRKIMSVCNELDGGKLAITEYEVLERFRNNCLVKFNLQTGRTHQIRVHCKDYLHHPITNDFEYGGSVPKILFRSDKKSLGQYLVAKKISFVHPKTKKQLEFSIPLPDYFEIFLTRLKNSEKN